MFILIAETLPPDTPTVVSRETDSLVIRSRKPSNTVTDDFEVTVDPEGGDIVKDVSGSYYKATIPGLSSGTEYTVTFRTVSGEETSTDVTGTFYTSKL